MLRPLAAVVAFATLCGLAGAGPLPDDSAYVTVRNGRLEAAGERVRLWCVIGGFPNYSGIEESDDTDTRARKRDRAYRDAEALVQRFEHLGFNGMRLWEKPSGPYVKGDGSNSDVLDYFVSVAKRRGFRIWVPSISTAPLRASDAGDHAELASAIGEDRPYTWIARVWVPELENAQVRHMQALADHVNLHTGLRWGDDPAFAIWELTNEEWWMQKMVGGQWRALPSYLQCLLLDKWHDFLRNKYKTNDALRQAWGFLLPFESLDGGKVELLPLASSVRPDLTGMDPQARRQLEASFPQTELGWSRDDFVRQRGADVLEFFVSLQLAHKQRLAAALETMGKSCKLGPVVFDTGIGYEIQSQYMHQHAEAVAHDAYINGFTENKLNPRYPWYSGLDEWPRIAQDVPWLEHNRVEGKPYLCYETQIMQPAKYRAEFPLRLLALASIQDWDAICWHYWGKVPDITTSERPFDRAMDKTVGWHPQGYHYTYDALQNSVMRAAAYAFRNQALAPALTPTKFLYGRRSLYDPASMDYGKSYGDLGRKMLPTTYAHGVRIWIDPNQIADRVDGPTVEPLAHTLPNLVRSTPEITFDIGRSSLIFDSPQMAGYTGFLDRFGDKVSFGSGLTLAEISVDPPAGMPYSEGLSEERYIAFALTSADGLDLSSTKRAILTIKSTSFNSGFKMLWQEDKLAEGGGLPVLEARIRATLTGQALAGMHYRTFDWHMQETGRGLVAKDGKLMLSSDDWTVELTR